MTPTLLDRECAGRGSVLKLRVIYNIVLNCLFVKFLGNDFGIKRGLKQS